MLTVKEGEYLESCKSNFSYLKPRIQDKEVVYVSGTYNLQFFFKYVYILDIIIYFLSSLLTNSFTRQLYLLLQQRRVPMTHNAHTKAEVFHKIWRRGAVVF
jgi:esterase/lipase superfamily enzyme